MKFSREQLYHRHRLSHQQIDDVLGESQAKLFIQDKLKQLADLKVFFEVTDLLKENNIDFLNLKGPVLSQRIYGDPTYRYYRDFDIMVSPEAVGKAFGILLKKGFLPNYFDWPASKQKQNAILKYINQTSFFHPEHEITVELHWRLFHREYLERNKEQELIQENTSVIDISGKEFKTLSPELDLVFLVIHGGVHAWARLKWLLDIHEFSKRLKIDSQLLKHIIKSFKAEKHFGLVATLLSDFFQLLTLSEYQVYVLPYTFRFSKSRILGESPKPYNESKSFMQYYFYLWLLSPKIRFLSSFLRFSSFEKEEVEQTYLPLHPVTVLYLRILRVFIAKKHNDVT